MSIEAPYFGIDFGTTNSSMAWYDPKTGRSETILNDHGEAKTSSIVYFGEEEILVGKDAVNVLEEFGNSSDPVERDDANQRVVRSIKRNLLNPPVIPIPGRKPVSPVEVVGQILGKLKHDAQEGFFYEDIDRVVITCPAIFGPQEQEVLLKAATMVGFRRVELLEEPTSAAMAFTRLGQKVGKGVVVVEPRKFVGRDYAVALGAAYHAHDLWKPPDEDVEEEAQEAKEYRRGLKICWQDRKLTKTEVEWLRSLAKQELKLSPDTAARIEREVMGDTIDGLLESREPVAREQYRKVLQLGWKDKKLDALRRIPPARLDMLLDNHELFRNRDFPDCPVSARERQEFLGEIPWPAFTMAARVVVGTNLGADAIADRLWSLADELGLSGEQASTVERGVLNATIRDFLRHQEQTTRQAAHNEYSSAVERAFRAGELSNVEVDRLGVLAGELGEEQAVAIERQMMGDTVEAILAEQREVGRLAQNHGIDLSQV